MSGDIWLGSISVFACLAREPTARVAVVSDRWIASLRPKPSVWDQLYAWLIEEHAATQNPTLHTRTFAGAATMDRLRDAERSRLLRSGVRGGDLANALAWSDCNAGPHETHDGWRLTGDGLFWVPYSDEWMRGGARAQATAPAAGSFVYFVRAGTAGHIKIGVARDVSARVASLQTGCPEPLHVLATVPGGRALEAALHAHLAEHRHHGEWFYAVPALMRLIDELRGCT